jgi:dihydroorotate dehydrogenase (NAD+) catalytic subunit
MRFNIDPPIMNASGIFCYASKFKRLESYGARTGAWVTKSYGLHEEEGNDNPVVCELPDDGMLNSIRLANPGAYWEKQDIEKVEETDPLAELYETPLEKPLILSLFGSRVEEYSIIIELFEKRVPNAAGYELNLSCPNKAPGEDKSIAGMIGDSPERVRQAIEGVRKVTQKPVIAKISPKISPRDVVPVIGAIIEAKADYICCANTMPGMFLNKKNKRPVLTGITGGLSGRPLKEINLAVAFAAYQVIKQKGADTGIIGCGGIDGVDDILDYRAVGADFVQIGTAFKRMRTEAQANFTKEIVRRLGIELAEIGREYGLDEPWKQLKGVAHCGGLMKKR